MSLFVCVCVCVHARARVCVDACACAYVFGTGKAHVFLAVWSSTPSQTPHNIELPSLPDNY